MEDCWLFMGMDENIRIFYTLAAMRRDASLRKCRIEKNVQSEIEQYFDSVNNFKYLNINNVINIKQMKKVFFSLAVAALMLVSAAITSCKEDDTMYTVTFDSKGGSKVAEQKVKEGDKAQEPDTPTLGNHNFVGWATADSETSPLWNFTTGTVTKDMTLYARWAALVKCEVCGEYNCEKAHKRCNVCDDWDCEEEHEQCEICGEYDCEKTHEQCTVCGEWDCEKTHEQCTVCGEWDCEKIHEQCAVCNDWDCEMDHSNVVNINDKTVAVIQSEINTALNADFSSVTVIGTANVSSITLTIPEGKNVNWNADITGLVILDASGGGNLIVTGSITSTERAITAFAGNVTVSGGTVMSTGSNSNAIWLAEEKQTATIDNGGVVRNRGNNGNYVAISTNSTAATVNIINGVAFSCAAVGVVQIFATLNIGDNGVAIWWTPATTPIIYEHSTNTNLTSNPANTATWCSEKQGIVNTRNDIVIQIEGVTVE